LDRRILAGNGLNMSNFAVAHMEDAIGNLSRLWVVSDHQDRLVEFAAGLAEHFKNSLGVLSVEVAGGFVGEDDGGAVDEGAGNGYALLLAT
jgi:hypothetical protein